MLKWQSICIHIDLNDLYIMDKNYLSVPYPTWTIFPYFLSLSRLVIPSYNKPLTIIAITLFQSSSSKASAYLNYQ